ncbi:MAG TPA: phosphate signaling complex protein PhoU [Kofleriaceae bacterium]|jgi:phosphate transport system protein
MVSAHTSKEFEQELRGLRSRLCAMGQRCEQQLALAMRALGERDDAIAQMVIDADQLIDLDESEIDELALQILATRQPVASDLRLITMSLKFVTDLERIGDLAVGIATRVLELDRFPPLERSPDLGSLATLVQRNLHAVLDSFATEDAHRAATVLRADREIDKRNSSLFAELIAHIATDPASVTRVLPLTSVCRYLERIGDHVKNLAEQIVYMVRAYDVRHRPPPPLSN